MLIYGRLKKTICIVITLCLILCRAAAGATENADVKSLNDAMERIGSADSLTIQMHLTLTQNEIDKLSGDVICQVDKEKEYLHATLTDDAGRSRDVEIASMDGERILRDGDDYYTMPEDWEQRTENSFIIPETISVDQLRKNLKKLIGSAIDKLAITDAGLSLHLTKNDIPFSLGLAVGFADGYEVKGDGSDEFQLSLGYGLYIDHIDLDIPLVNGDVGEIQMEIALGGRSRDGESLDTSITMDCSFSDIGSTTPATIDTTGIELKPLEQK